MRFSEIIQASKIANGTENSLFFIDFWATWCGPCVYASEYLGVLQQQNPDRFYIISLTEENPEKVKRFLVKHPTDLAVAIDYEGETFSKNKIRALPDGILINAEGSILWKGNPTDFKQADLDRFLRQNTKTSAINKVIKTVKVKEEKVVPTYLPKKDFEIKILKNEVVETLEINQIKDFTILKGDLQSIMASQLKVLNSQVKVPSHLNKTYKVYFKNNGNAKYNILKALNLDYFYNEKEGDVLSLDVSQFQFWDTQQIDWGKNIAKYLIDDSQIQADNVTFNDVLYQLSKVLEIPIVALNGTVDDLQHDWQIHHRFYNLMQTDLLDNYGLIAKKQLGTYKQYTITKKTP